MRGKPEVDQFRKDFPYLQTNKPLIYLDSAATSQKPLSVLQAMENFYKNDYAPVHRGIYQRAEHATELYEAARQTVADFITADPDEILFTQGTTESINFVATSWAMNHLKTGDEIIITQLEHHSNLVPWIRVAQQLHLTLKYVPVLADGTLNYEAYSAMLSPRSKLIAFTLTSNALGTNTNASFIIGKAKAVGAKVLVDAAQTVAHHSINAHGLAIDFLAFSAHKMLGPTGIGVLYAARSIQNELEPYQVGGGMVYEVHQQSASWLKSPHKYEAGTPAIAQAIGLGAAIDYLKNRVDFTLLREYEAFLCRRLIEGLQSMPRVQLLGPIDQLMTEGHIVSFSVDGIHAHDVAAYLDRYGIAVRAGNQCAQVLHKALGISSSVRISFYLYNTAQEVDILLARLKKLLEQFSIS